MSALRHTLGQQGAWVSRNNLVHYIGHHRLLRIGKIRQLDTTIRYAPNPTVSILRPGRNELRSSLFNLTLLGDVLLLDLFRIAGLHFDEEGKMLHGSGTGAGGNRPPTIGGSGRHLPLDAPSLKVPQIVKRHDPVRLGRDEGTELHVPTSRGRILRRPLDDIVAFRHGRTDRNDGNENVRISHRLLLRLHVGNEELDLRGPLPEALTSLELRLPIADVVKVLRPRRRFDEPSRGGQAPPHPNNVDGNLGLVNLLGGEVPELLLPDQFAELDVAYLVVDAPASAH
mmetsp:Transcript_31349/g.63716  ORF Transcript_31349/g.63716 Transcript_31349/m.63716 type:complete len:284 (+) Transcript_31349:116-967(+)